MSLDCCDGGVDWDYTLMCWDFCLIKWNLENWSQHIMIQAQE